MPRENEGLSAGGSGADEIRELDNHASGVEITAVALAGAALVPFLQAMSTHLGGKAGEAIARVWEDLVHMRPRPAIAEAAALEPEAPYEMLLAGPNGAVVVLNSELPAEAVRQLVDIGAEGLETLGTGPTLRWHGQIWRANLRQGAETIEEQYWSPATKTWEPRPPSAG